MKRTGIKKLELKRLTVKQLSEASGGAGHVIGSAKAGCSNSCNTCIDPALCGGYVYDPDATYDADGCSLTCGGGGGCGGGCAGNLCEMQAMC